MVWKVWNGMEWYGLVMNCMYVCLSVCMYVIDACMHACMYDIDG